MVDAEQKFGGLLLATGSAGTLGIFSLALLVAISDVFLLSALALNFVSTGLLIFMALLGRAVFRLLDSTTWQKSALRQWSFGSWLFALAMALLILAVLASQLWQATLIPLSAWDALQGGEWRVPSYGERAINVIEHTQGLGRDWNPYDYRHPPTNFLLLSSSTVIFGIAELPGKVVWVLMLFFCAVSCAGYAMLLSSSIAIGGAISALVLNLPLAENNAILYGYNDLILYACVIHGCIFIQIALKGENRVGFSLLTAAFLFGVTFSKSVGPVFCLAMLTAVALSQARKSLPDLSKKYHLARRLGALPIVVSNPYLLAATILVAGILGLMCIALLSPLWGAINLPIFGRTLVIQGIMPQALFRNWSHALFYLQSFGAIPLIMMGTIGFHALQRRADICYGAPKSSFLVILSALLVTVLNGYQATNYGAWTALPGSDTLFSRLLLPLVGVMIISFLEILSTFQVASPSTFPQSRQ